MHRTRTAALAATLLMSALSIGTVAQSPATGGSGGELDGTSWDLVEYVSGGTFIGVEPGYLVDATFRDGLVSGFSGCDDYVAPVTVEGAAIAVGTIATTGRMCKMAIPIEQDYLAAFAAAATFTATADALTIHDAAGSEILGYASAPDDPLGGPWTVTGFTHGAEALVAPVTGSQLTVSFSPDGQVFGSSGCNTYNGPFTFEDGALTVGALAMTTMACDDALMAQEQQFLTALQEPARVELSGPTVTLRDEAGAIQVVLSRP